MIRSHLNVRSLAIVAVALGALGLLLGGAGLLATASGSEDVTDIGTSHPLADDAALTDFETTGTAGGELTRYQIGLTAAEDGTDVGLEQSLARDARNDYVRIDYRESHSRTVRILLPRDYITPYTMESVDALDSDHVASYKPARDGDYLAITITFEGEGSAVLPLQKDSSASYTIVEYVDDRVERVTGISPLGRSGEWQYIDGDEVASEPSYALNSTEDVLVQYDARPNESEETWINAPEGETNRDDIYYFTRESDDQTYIVAGSDARPDVRIKFDYDRTDELRGDVNEVGLVFDRVRDGDFGDLPFLGDE